MGNSEEKQKLKDKFRVQLLRYVDLFNDAISTAEGDWIVKGFIDVALNIYTISTDTKVVSKIMELLLFPKLCQFADDNQYKMVLCTEQNSYPDISFIDGKGNKFAVDLKSTYRISDTKVNGMTLGAFTGYFRKAESNKNITFPYQEYIGHYVLGVLYSRIDGNPDERKIYKLKDLKNIVSVVKDFSFFVQEKYRIAVDRPGSGNTKNIGSVTKIDDLVNGKGPFAQLGEQIFNDYWMYYSTKDMAKLLDLQSAPYKNLNEYKKYKKINV